MPRLVASDAQSQVKARCPNGDWLLDVALPPGAAPPPTPPVSAGNADPLTGRRLARVTADGTARQLLDPRINGRSFYICDNRQVWGLRFQPPSNAGAGDEPYMAIYTSTHQSLTMPQAQVPLLPGPGWFMGIPALDGAQILLVDKADLRLANPQIALAVADPDGGRLRALGTFSGTLDYNSFSADGRWLVVTLNNSGPLPASQQHQRVLLFDLYSSRAPQTLADVPRDALRTDDLSYLYALFLNRPPYAGRICILRFGTTPGIRLLAPDGSTPEQTYTIPPPFYLTHGPAIDSASGQLLLSGSTDNPPRAGQRAALVLLTPPDQVTLHVLPVPQDQQLQGMLLRAGRILYQAGSDSSYQSEGTQSLTFYSLPLTDFGKTPLAPTTVYSGTRTLNTRQYTKSWRAATAWLTYTTPSGELHTRRYDGTGDVLLERGVSSFAASPFFSWDWDDP